MWLKMNLPVSRLMRAIATVPDRVAASPTGCWWANYGLSLCAADDTVVVASERTSRCPVLRAVAAIKVGG